MTISEKLLSEINIQKETSYKTKRVISSELEEILYDLFPVLDHGFVRVVDYMGNDSSIVQAARVSYGAGTKQSRQDQGLINYLMRHRHTTPFEMCDIKFHIKLPIFIARQWIRHRTASVNEYSARYSILSNEFYLPEIENISAQSQQNKQGRSDDVLPSERAREVLDIIKNDSLRCYENYTNMLNENLEGDVIDEDKIGITRELARMNLTLNHYTEWYWKINLHNLLHFLSLRADSHAQYEIREYANVMLDIVKKWVPFTHDAFINHRKEGFSFSKAALIMIKNMINGKKISQEESNLSVREYNEVMQKLNQL